jgi:hypothetical protein
MGRLLDRLKVKCRRCTHWHIPRRLTARYIDGDKKRLAHTEKAHCSLHRWRQKATTHVAVQRVRSLLD